MSTPFLRAKSPLASVSMAIDIVLGMRILKSTMMCCKLLRAHLLQES